MTARHGVFSAVGAAATLALGVAPSGALASSYVALAIDRSTLTVTDLTSPRISGDQAQTFEIVIYRSPMKGKRGLGEYVINKIDIDCKGGRFRRNYSATFSMTSALVDYAPTPTRWGPISTGSIADRLRDPGCRGKAPPIAFRLGDVRVGAIISSYRAGAYDRFIPR